MEQPVFPRIPEGFLPAAGPDEGRPFLHALLNAPGWALGFLDRELRLRWANDALVALAGRPLASQLGRAVGELWPALSSPLGGLCARALQGEVISGVALTCTTPEGAALHLRVTLMPAVAGGLMSGLTLLAQDETLRVREHTLLRESEERMKALVDISCDGYIIHDGGTLLDVSRGCASLFDSTPEELIGDQLMNWTAPESRPVFAEAVRKGTDTPYEVVALRRDGRRLPLQVLAREVDYRGHRARLVALWNISGHKAAQEAAARDESFREQLLGVVGNDLSAPLKSLHLGLSSLQQEGKLEAGQARQLTGAAKRMDRMLRELLDFIRARMTGTLPVTPAPMSLETAMERAVEEQQKVHPERPLIRAVEGDLRGQWDETRLTQLLEILLSNALQHSNSSNPVELSAQGRKDGVTVAVLDKGPPLLPEEHESLFEPFRKGRKQGREGMGLGLYLSRRIAEAHGGRITVESSVEQGTCFKVWLPRQIPAL
ncbi:ATP-binding protein [Stigmatella sp. ncwal1]|uniref:histidine kinase n=1 Tax=Stigmatella ashevillensis TaxID=2995309 RepID=A0ABT5DHL6_9BACT|nr:ATP-binding protein [Stigmatella ashevillena]MDC0712625.1 ATP-binding protein [Stigmatella ashevillena]